MTSPELPADGNAKTMFTWRSADGDRLEQVRLNTGGGRLRAYGRIIAAETDDTEAFSASYELVTNDIGVTRRLSVRLIRAGGEGQLDVSRDMDGRWMVQTPQSTVHSDFGGAETIDVALSPFFTSLPIHRYKLVGGGAAADIPVVRLALPDFDIEPVRRSYTVDGARVSIASAGGTEVCTIDDAGLVTDFPGLATRI